jgi:hypothetical protein
MLLSNLVSQQDCFVTRVWGFTPETWGAMGFPKEGTTEKWLKRDPLRVVCFVSHHAADHISETDRGRVLGIYELHPERVVLESDDVIAPDHLADPVMRRENGQFRWPVGLRARRAWRFSSPAPLTRESLPDARRLGQDASTDLVMMSAHDYSLLNQKAYKLEEVPVYGIDWLPPKREADPVAVPCHLYVFATAHQEVLARLPGWRPGEILVKIGCASDVQQRLDSFNNDPVSKIFRFKLSKIAEKFVGEKDARPRETELLKWAAINGRPAAELSTEFFFVTEPVYRNLQNKFSTVFRVA